MPKNLSMGFGQALSIVNFFHTCSGVGLKAEICTSSYFDDNKRDFRDKYLKLFLNEKIGESLRNKFR